MKIENKIQENIPLAHMTTFKIGGSAKFFIVIKTKEELISTFNWAKEHKEKVYILGGGSNLLISDKGVNGLVIKFENTEVTVKGERIESSAGAQLSQVVSIASSHNLTGMEWAAGVPGTVGGAIRGNAGCFGSNIEQVLETANIYIQSKTDFMTYSKNNCKFTYRDSIFKSDSNLIIWESTFKLKNGSLEEIKRQMNDIINIRNRSFPGLPSAGSVFKGLLIDDIKINNPKLAKHLEKHNAVRNGKVGTRWLIDQLGLKGEKIGGAKISLEHANFIVNTGKATAKDVITLINIIKEKVLNQYNIQLQEEIQYFGL